MQTISIDSLALWFLVGFSKWKPWEGDQREEKYEGDLAGGRGVEKRAPAVWLHLLTHGHSCQGPLYRSWCSHLSYPFKPRDGQVAVTYYTTVVFLHPAHTFVNSPFIQLSSNYSIWVCHLFPAQLWPDINRKAATQRPPSLHEKLSLWVQDQSQVCVCVCV